MSDAKRAARAQEMEKKRQKLTEMKARKAENEQKKGQSSQEDLEKLLHGLGIGAEPSRAPLRVIDVENTILTPTAADCTKSPVVVVETRSISLELTKASSVIVPVMEKKVQYSKFIQTEEELVPTRQFSIGSQEVDFNDDTFNCVHNPQEVPEDAVEEKKYESPTDFCEEEKNRILERHDFQQFFHFASRNLEKTILDCPEMYVDYSGDTTMELEKETALLESFAQRESNKTKNRPVVGISFGKQRKEFAVVAYGPGRDQPQKVDGVVCIWNTHSKMDVAEFSFQHNSRLTSVSFAHFHKDLVLIGCHSGEILLWDYRNVTRKLPVQKSPLTIQTHSRPIFNLGVAGTRNSHAVWSVSSEGKLCFWKIEDLTKPVESKELQSKNAALVTALSVSFCSNVADNFITGSYDGKVSQFNKTNVEGGAILFSNQYEGHGLSVLAVDAHPAVDFSHLFLTAGADWTIKLWSSKTTMLNLTFDAHLDRVADVKWSPVHPAVFASVDHQGVLLLWNLNETIEHPVLTLDVAEGKAMLMKLAWSEDGRKLCVGDSNGVVYVYDAHRSLYAVNNKVFTKFARVLADVKKQEKEATVVDNTLSEAIRW